jgi:hypothetical protein
MERTASPVAARLVDTLVEFAKAMVPAEDAVGIGPGLSTARVQVWFNAAGDYTAIL